MEEIETGFNSSGNAGIGKGKLETYHVFKFVSEKVDNCLAQIRRLILVKTIGYSQSGNSNIA
ncbi:MAG: hypothetical protein ACE5KV_03140 [Thermoplasmata archaeon]